MRNYIYIIAPIAGWAVAQFIKFLLSLRKDGTDWQDLFQSGGMPSSHSAFMVSMAFVIGYEQGFSSPLFAVAAALTAIIVYDSVGVRRTVGEHTLAIKEISSGRETIETIIHDAKGHNVPEVFAGVAVGIFVGIILELLL